MKKYIPVIIALVTLSVILVACGGNNNTVQNCNISNISVTSISELEEMEQPTTLTAGKQIFSYCSLLNRCGNNRSVFLPILE